MMAILGGKKNRARWFRKKPETPEICSGLMTLRQSNIRRRTMPMMFPGRGMPTMRWRNSPARQMAKMTASCRGVLMAGVNVEKGLSLVKMAFRGVFGPFQVEEL